MVLPDYRSKNSPVQRVLETGCLSPGSRRQPDRVGAAETSAGRGTALFVAAHARALDLTMVTNDTAEFGRVKGLELEHRTIPLRRKK